MPVTHRNNGSSNGAASTSVKALRAIRKPLRRTTNNDKGSFPPPQTESATPFQEKPKPHPKARVEPVPPDLAGPWDGDLRVLNENLPKPGAYDGLIANIEFFDREADLLMIVTYEIDGHEVELKKDFSTVRFRKDALADGTLARDQVVRGMRTLKKICDWLGVSYTDAVANPEILTEHVGRPLTLIVGHRRTSSGIKELVVNALKPKA